MPFLVVLSLNSCIFEFVPVFDAEIPTPLQVPTSPTTINMTQSSPQNITYLEADMDRVCFTSMLFFLDSILLTEIRYYND